MTTKTEQDIQALMGKIVRRVDFLKQAVDRKVPVIIRGEVRLLLGYAEEMMELTKSDDTRSEPIVVAEQFEDY